MKTLTKPLKDIGFLTIALTLALAANFAYGQWAEPATLLADPTPGVDNVDAPINVGIANQIKTGDITAWNQKAGNEMWSPWYCDENGPGPDLVPGTADDNCVDASTLGVVTTGGGGGWDYISTPVAFDGNGKTFTVDTGFGKSPTDVVVDMVAIRDTGGFQAGDIIHDIGSVKNAIVDTYRNQDSGTLVFSRADGTVNIHVHSMGIVVLPPTTYRGGVNLTLNDWVFVVKANNGSYPAIPELAPVCTAYGPGSITNAYGSSCAGACTVYGCP